MENAGLKIKEKIYRSVARVEKSPEFINIRNGRLSIRQIRYYLSSIHQLFRSTPRLFSLAACIAQERSHADLLQWYMEKLSEGAANILWSSYRHDVYKNDQFNVENLRSLVAAKQLVYSLETSIIRSPVSLLGYIATAQKIDLLTCNAAHAGDDEYIHSRMENIEAYFQDIETLLQREDLMDIFAVIDIFVDYYFNMLNELENLNTSTLIA